MALIGAIIINLIANLIGIPTWYDLMDTMPGPVGIIFLVIPLMLGALGYYTARVL